MRSSGTASGSSAGLAAWKQFRATMPGARDGPNGGLTGGVRCPAGFGHGCGHNLIAMSNLGAGLGVKATLQSLPGRLMVLGTPAEEGGGGKIRLLDAGVFKDVDVVRSSHPSSNRTIIPMDIPKDQSWSLAMVGYRYAYHGKAAHAAVVPHEGINALNAVIHLFTGIDALRQHLREDVRIHGIITDGGKQPTWCRTSPPPIHAAFKRPGLPARGCGEGSSSRRRSSTTHRRAPRGATG